MDTQHLPSDHLKQQAVQEYCELLQKYPDISPEFLTQQGLQMQSSTSLPASAYPTQSQALSSDMSRRHSTAVDSVAAMQARIRDSSRQYQTQPNPHIDNWYSETETLSNSRKQPRHIPGPLLDIQEYMSQNGTENIDVQSYSPSFSEQQYDSNWLSPTHQSSHYSFNSSPTDTSPINTPSTTFTTTSTHSPIDMSRDCSIASNLSLGHSLQNDLAMLRVNSNASHFSHSRSQSGAALSAPLLHFARSRSNSHAQIPSPHISHDLNSPQFTSNQFVSSSQQSFDFATSMTRSDSSQSNLSTSSTQSRASRRSHEISQHAQRDLAPKGSDSVHAIKMKRIRSGDGSYKNKAEIPREAPNYKRPQHPKLYCPHCEDHPDGFRGDHELQRHVSRAHPMPGCTRKVWVCVDASKDGKPFLQNCKACRTNKKYGAYYNAAAHLRRAHFNPRKRGRKAKNETEKRGGKGGGSWPPMEDLKEHWIREVEEVVDADTKPFSKDDDEADLIDHEPEFDPSNANVTSFVGGAFESNNATPQVSYDLVFDNTTVDTIDPVNFNTPPFTSALDIHSFNGYDLASQATGMSDFAAQQFGDDNMYQQAFDDSHFLPQQHQLVVQQDTAYWGSV